MGWRRLDSVVVGAPVADRLFDGFGVHGLAGCLFGEGDEFGVGGEAEGDDLLHGEAGVEEAAGEDEVAEVFFGADGAVLRLEGEDAREERGGNGHTDQDDDKGSAVEP